MSINTTDKGVILIVDDNNTKLELLVDLLGNSGFTVLIAENGERAVEIAENALPDLILLNLLMPKMDSFETYRRLKLNPVTQEIHVIFLTDPIKNKATVTGLDIGDVDYITKPLDNDETLARVHLHLRIRHLTKKIKEQNELLEKEVSERQRLEQEREQAFQALQESEARFRRLFVLNLTEHKQAEQKIREQAALLNITTDAILVRDFGTQTPFSDNQIQFWNKGAEHLYGWSAQEAIGKNANELLYKQENPPPFEDIQISLIEHGSWQGELRQVTKDGKEIIVASRWTLMHNDEGQSKSILTVNTDITEKKQLEAQFLQAQRMESVGTLASGIAHDLNNALTPMMMTVQLLQTQLLNEQGKQWLSILEKNIRHATDLVKQVLWFSQGHENQFTTLQLRHLILELEQIVRQTFPKSIDIRVDIPTPNLWTISGNATQLQQVLMNLCINARDAMPRGGLLKISARNIWIDAHHKRTNIDAKVGPYVAITVSDTGMGISKEIIDRIFEPFFTTKELGKGTGLGLSTVLGIIKSHDGFINVESQIRKETKFQLYIPVQQIDETDEVLTGHNELLSGHGELVLVVDDDDSIREITKNLLERNDYKVIVARDGIEAVALYTRYMQEIRVVIIDMMMPSMDGPTTIRILKRINPKVKIIGISGLVSNHEMIKIVGDSVTTFLAKPFTLDELLENLQSVLNSDSRYS